MDIKFSFEVYCNIELEKKSKYLNFSIYFAWNILVKSWIVKKILESLDSLENITNNFYSIEN